MAKATCDAGRVQVNGHVARAGHQVRLDDIVTLDLTRRLLKFKVRSLPDRAPGKVESREMIEVLENIRKEDEG